MRRWLKLTDCALVAAVKKRQYLTGIKKRTASIIARDSISHTVLDMEDDPPKIAFGPTLTNVNQTNAGLGLAGLETDTEGCPLTINPFLCTSSLMNSLMERGQKGLGYCIDAVTRNASTRRTFMLAIHPTTTRIP